MKAGDVPEGMTLLDYFAAKAMPMAIRAMPVVRFDWGRGLLNDNQNDDGWPTEDQHVTAERAYLMAKAMVLEKERLETEEADQKADIRREQLAESNRQQDQRGTKL